MPRAGRPLRAALLVPLLLDAVLYRGKTPAFAPWSSSLGVGHSLRVPSRPQPTRHKPRARPGRFARRTARRQQPGHVQLAPQTAVDALVSDSDAAAYRRDGVVHLPGIFGREWVALMRQAFAEAVDRPSPHAESARKQAAWWNPFESGGGGGLEMFMDHFFFEEVAGRAPGWSAVAEASPAAAIMAKLMGSSEAVFFYGQLIMKRGGAEHDIPWHQDLPYWNVDGSQIGTVWVALDDMPAEAGVRYIPGSHRWSELQQFYEAPPGEASALAFDVAAGDAICFDARVVHGSRGSPEGPDHVHRRVALRFGGDDVVYRRRRGHAPIPTAEVDKAHGLQHGDPLACAAFPRVYKTAESRVGVPR